MMDHKIILKDFKKGTFLCTHH